MENKRNSNNQEVCEQVLDGMTSRIKTDHGLVILYQQFIPAFGLLDVKFIENSLSPNHLEILRHHAKAFACLNGNSFGSQTEHQYVDVAYANLWSNSALDDIPNLYPATPLEQDWASVAENSEQYETILSNMHFHNLATTPERKEEIISHFRS